MAEQLVIPADQRKSLESAIPAMIDAHRKLEEMIEKSEDGWVRVMFQVNSGRVLKSTVEQHVGYPGVSKQVDGNGQKG